MEGYSVDGGLALTPFYSGKHLGVGGFLPAVKQIANVAALPGIVGVRLGGDENGSLLGFCHPFRLSLLI